MAEGLKITLSGIGRGLTRDQHGRKLLPHPFIFQCPPLEEHKVQHQYNFGNYDTILEGQFARAGARQLMTWQWDTLVMYLALNVPYRTPGSRLTPRNIQHSPRVVQPGWVPFPNPKNGAKDRTYNGHYTPEWYRQQLRQLHDSGAPFVYEAKLAGIADAGPILRTHAVLTGFSEALKHGEGDCLYFEGVAFTEWRDPTVKQFGVKHRKKTMHLPTTVYLAKQGNTFFVQWHGNSLFFNNDDLVQVVQGTLSRLAKYFYGNANWWRRIAKANHVKNGAGDTPLQELDPFKNTNFDNGERRAIKIPVPPPENKRATYRRVRA